MMEISPADGGKGGTQDTELVEKGGRMVGATGIEPVTPTMST